jgi:hypothetical protein
MKKLPRSASLDDNAHDTKLRAFPDVNDAGRAMVAKAYNGGEYLTSANMSAAGIRTIIISRPLLHLPVQQVRFPRLPRLPLGLRVARPRAVRRARRTSRSSAVSSAGSGDPPPRPAAPLVHDGAARRPGHGHAAALLVAALRATARHTDAYLTGLAATPAGTVTKVVAITFVAWNVTGGAGAVEAPDAAVGEPGDDGVGDAGNVEGIQPGTSFTCAAMVGRDGRDGGLGELRTS